ARALLLSRCVRLDPAGAGRMADAARAQGLLHGRPARAVVCGTLDEIPRRVRRVVPADPARGDRGGLAVAIPRPRRPLVDGGRHGPGRPGVLSPGTVPNTRD